MHGGDYIVIRIGDVPKEIVPANIFPNDVVTVTKMNHILEVQHMEKMNHVAHIKKLSKDEYVDLGTGEIKEFNHSENRKDNYNSLRQTFKKLRYLINNNFEGKRNELHIILTYDENMKDTKRLYSDFKRFMMRLKRKYTNTTVDYINVVEPQERGAWHSHLLIRFNDLDKIYISNSDLSKLWEQGFVTIKSLNEVDNIGAYLSAYLSDVELTDNTVGIALQESRDVQIKIVDGQPKKFVKGGRLHMYPPGMNLYRKSKGVEMPERKNMKYRELKKIVKHSQPHYSKSYEIEKDDFSNTIQFEQYNLKRT